MEAAQPCGVEPCQHCEARTWDQHLPCRMQTLLLGETSTCGGKHHQVEVPLQPTRGLTGVYVCVLMMHVILVVSD